LHQTYVPDYLNGDIFPTEGNINVTEWLAKHGESQTTPPLLVVINALKSQGFRQMAAALVVSFFNTITQLNSRRIPRLVHNSPRPKQHHCSWNDGSSVFS
jgi:hypothetical protein